MTSNGQDHPRPPSLGAEVQLRVPISSPDITTAEVEAVCAVLQTPRLSLGPKLVEFETRLAALIGTRHAVGVSSGTAGLHLSVMALGIGAGDRVITTPFSFIASANAILFERAEPVFVDIDPRTLNIDPERVANAARRGAKAVLAVDVFGLPADWDALRDIAARFDLRTIEDSCEALGATYQGRPAGTMADVGVFGFYPNKQITTGEGGMIVTHDDRIARLCRALRNQGRLEDVGWLQHELLGYNYRLDELSCALGIVQLSRLAEMQAKREQVAHWYNERLADLEACTLLPGIPGSQRSWFVYVILLRLPRDREVRDRVIQQMRARGVECANYFAPIHLQSYYARRFGFRRGDLPITEDVADRSLALPMFSGMTEDQVDHVVRSLRDVLVS